MIISKVSRMDLYEALKQTNNKFGNNVDIFKMYSLNMNGTRWSVRLCINNKEGPGAKRLNPYYAEQNNFYQAPIPWACWHVHGEFFTNLLEINPYARIRSGYYNSPKAITKENWVWEPVDLEKKTGGREQIRKWGTGEINFNRSNCFCLGDDYYISKYVTLS
jgi:hypothetical protein